MLLKNLMTGSKATDFDVGLRLIYEKRLNDDTEALAGLTKMEKLIKQSFSNNKHSKPIGDK